STWDSTPNAEGRVPENRAFRPHFASEELKVQEALGYLQVDLWPDVLSLYGDFNAAGGGVTARETVAILKLPYDIFFKGGRFFPPFGLRLYEDASYVRTDTGFTFQNPDEGAELGIIPGPFYLAASVTNGAGGDRDVLTSLNAYGMLDDLPVVWQGRAGGSLCRQAQQST